MSENDDYDNSDYDHGLPDAAFTEDELAAGVQFLMRGTSPPDRFRLVSEGRRMNSRFAPSSVASAHNDKDPLFLALRAWRRETANEKGVPAYVILHDIILHRIAARRPATLAELGETLGLGAAKLEAYGEAVLAVVAQR